MEEWMRQSVSQLKRLVKSRAGRVAELQMEIKILEGLIERKVASGDLGGLGSSTPEREPSAEPVQTAQPAPPATAPNPQLSSPVAETKAAVQAKDVTEAKSEDKATIPEPAEHVSMTEQTKITRKSSTHAFKEID